MLKSKKELDLYMGKAYFPFTLILCAKGRHALPTPLTELV